MKIETLTGGFAIAPPHMIAARTETGMLAQNHFAQFPVLNSQFSILNSPPPFFP
jgi:hypothetical protein